MNGSVIGGVVTLRVVPVGKARVWVGTCESHRSRMIYAACEKNEKVLDLR